MNPYGYWEYPYDVLSYWLIVQKYKKKKRLYSDDAYGIESSVLDMTHAMKWMLKVLKHENPDMFDHDYYEVVGERKELLEIFKKFRPKDYELFIKCNPKVLVYEKYEHKEEKKPKAPIIE